MTARWVFAADGTAIQMKYVIRMWVDSKGDDSSHLVMCVVEGKSPLFVIGRFSSKSKAEEHIKDLIVGRAPKDD